MQYVYAIILHFPTKKAALQDCFFYFFRSEKTPMTFCLILLFKDKISVFLPIALQLLFMMAKLFATVLTVDAAVCL